MKKVLLVASLSVVGAIGGYFKGWVFALDRSEHWIALKESNDRTSRLLKDLKQALEMTNQCSEPAGKK